MHLIVSLVITCSALDVIQWLVSSVYSPFILKLDYKNHGQKGESQTEPALFSVTWREVLVV